MNKPLPKYPADFERMTRLHVSLAAYAYALGGTSVMSDSMFDLMAATIKPDVDTGDAVLDKFFREVFSPGTGMWIHNHPYLKEVRAIYLDGFPGNEGIMEI